MNNSRIGKIYVNPDVLGFEQAAALLSKLEFFPYRVEYLYARQAFELVGQSPHFDVLGKGYNAPEYTIEITESKDGEIETVKAVPADG